MLRESITRRNLPHWHVPHAWQFVTYRLAGTIPATVLHRLREDRNQRWRQAEATGTATPDVKEQLHKQFFAAYDQYLDRTCKVDWLAKSSVATRIRENLYHHRGSKYDLLAYCVMPNHVHVLLRPLEAPPSPLDSPQARLLAATGDEGSDRKGPLAAIMHSLKSYTANEANKLLGRSGQFWQHESFDHWVRDDDELERIVTYIVWNPVKAGLVTKPHEWHCGSARDRYLLDGSEEGYLLPP